MPWSDRSDSFLFSPAGTLFIRRASTHPDPGKSFFPPVPHPASDAFFFSAWFSGIPFFAVLSSN
jgi:hypothetical protein